MRVSSRGVICLGAEPTWEEQIVKATEANLLQFLKKSPQFVIPIYQRTY